MKFLFKYISANKNHDTLALIANAIGRGIYLED